MRPASYSQYQRSHRRRRNVATSLATGALLLGLLYTVSDRACSVVNSLFQNPQSGNPAQGSGKGPKVPGQSYDNRGGTGQGHIYQLDPQAHLEEAKKVRYEVQAQDGKNPSDKNNPKKKVPPTIDDTLSKGAGRENYERHTSYIIPRPTVGIDQNIRDALVCLDLSSSMTHQVVGGINMSSVAAIAISNYYINEKGSMVAGMRFNDRSNHTNYTDDLEFLAKFFAQRPDGGTVFDVPLLQQIANDPNRPNASKPLDLYVISDLGFSNIADVINNLGKNSKLGRIYVLVVDDPQTIVYGTQKNNTTVLFGKDAYRAPLNDFNDLYTFYRRFTQDSAQPMPKNP